MTGEESYQITSNDFADLIVEYNRDVRVFERYPNANYQIMNERFAIVYVPVADLSGVGITQFGYSVLPSCFGITSTRGLEASGVLRLRRLPAFNLRGQGVLVGIIDTGIDYANPIFLKEDGTSRIAFIWDQTIESNRYPSPMLYGTEYTMEDINQALSSDNPLDVVPSMDENGHGTLIAGIAAGNEVNESDFSGVVPDAELIVVKLKQAKQNLIEFNIIPEGVPAFQENDIMWATQYIINKARILRRPVSILIGLGTSQGSHDGSGALSSELSTIADFSGVVVTIAAGNEGNMRRHFYNEIDSELGYTTVELNVSEGEKGFIMELWGTAPNTYSIDILSPSGEYIPRIAESLRVNRDISFVFERTTIHIEYQMVEAQSGDQLILMRFDTPTPGIWRFQVYSRGDLQGAFHIWLPMNDFISENTYFIQSDPYTTVTSPGNAIVPITVTAYNPNNGNIYQRASRGYSRINTIKPELAAPGVNILGPTLEHGFERNSGTSVAAAHATGVAAMLLEWGIVRGNYAGIDSVEVKKFLIRGARRSPSLTYPNRDWGYGILDIFNVYDILRANT